MAINPKELQRFLAAWQPVMHTGAPAVINTAEHEADLGRHVVTPESMGEQLKSALTTGKFLALK